MRQIIFLFFSAFLLFSCGNVNISDFAAYPKLKTIVERLDDNYKIRTSEKVDFSVAKKPEGWYVVRLNKKTQKPVAEELFWSAKDKSYVKIPRNFFNSPESTGDIQKISRDFYGRDYQFDHSVYFGYDNWEDDVIDALEDANNLNDTLLESLARAYANKCMTISRPEKEAVANRSGKMSDEKAKEFCSYGNKETETYKKLLEMNPDYETIVGKVQTKLSNEYMFLWSELKQAGRDKEAEQFLIDGLYDNLMINFAKNMLNFAEKDAILFCNGDNDTYPLWYAQEKLGVRKDIAVMNTSLINIPSWVFSDKRTYKFDLSISEKAYFDSLTEAIYLNTENEEIAGMDALKKSVEEKGPSVITEQSGSTLLKLPFNNIRLSYTANDSLAPVVHLNSYYILKSDMVMMDIISSNLERRPIYFAQTAIYGTLASALTASLCHEGLLVRVVHGKNNGTFSGDKYYDLDLCYKNAVSSYNYGIDNMKTLQVEPIAANYVYNFHHLSAALLEHGDSPRAAQAIETCISKIPMKLFSGPTVSYLMGDDMCNAMNFEEGQKLFALCIDKIKIAYTDPNNSNELERYLSLLERINETSGKHGFKELSSSALRLKKKINDKIRDSGRVTETLKYH